MVLGIVFQRRVVDTVKDLPPSDSRLNRGQTRFSSPCLLDLSFHGEGTAFSRGSLFSVKEFLV